MSQSRQKCCLHFGQETRRPGLFPAKQWKQIKPEEAVTSYINNYYKKKIINKICVTLVYVFSNFFGYFKLLFRVDGQHHFSSILWLFHPLCSLIVHGYMHPATTGKHEWTKQRQQKCTQTFTRLSRRSTNRKEMNFFQTLVSWMTESGYHLLGFGGKNGRK